MYNTFHVIESFIITVSGIYFGKLRWLDYITNIPKSFPKSMQKIVFYRLIFKNQNMHYSCIVINGGTCRRFFGLKSYVMICLFTVLV